jgi:hypothetical protein
MSRISALEHPRELAQVQSVLKRSALSQMSEPVRVFLAIKPNPLAIGRGDGGLELEHVVHVDQGRTAGHHRCRRSRMVVRLSLLLFVGRREGFLGRVKVDEHVGRRRGPLCTASFGGGVRLVSGSLNGMYADASIVVGRSEAHPAGGIGRLGRSGLDIGILLGGLGQHRGFRDLDALVSRGVGFGFRVARGFNHFINIDGR